MEENIQSPTITELQKVIADFRERFEHRSFSQRNPELGKMINCAVCSRRHRTNIICQQKFVVELVPPDGLTNLTAKQVVGAAAFKGKRILPHHSKLKLQLVQKTIDLYPQYVGLYPSTEDKSLDQVGVEVARRYARQELKKKRNEKRARRNRMQKKSRKTNASNA